MITVFVKSVSEMLSLIQALKATSPTTNIKCYSIVSSTLQEELNLLLQEELELERLYPTYALNTVRIVRFRIFGGMTFTVEQSYKLVKELHQNKQENKFHHELWQELREQCWKEFWASHKP